MNSVELIKKICKERKIPISRLERDLKYGNGYISQLKKGTVPSNRAVEIANYLDITVDYLMTGKEEAEKKEITLTAKDERDIEKKLNETLDQIVSEDGLMFNGEIMDERTKQLLEISLRNTIESAKIAAKKFTPNKYKK